MRGLIVCVVVAAVVANKEEEKDFVVVDAVRRRLAFVGKNDILLEVKLVVFGRSVRHNSTANRSDVVLDFVVSIKDFMFVLLLLFFVCDNFKTPEATNRVKKV